MFLPLGDTGFGKMGEMPPTSQELRKSARAATPVVVRSARALRITKRKYIDDWNRVLGVPAQRPDRIHADCGRCPKASLCRRVQSQPVGRVSALRPPDGPLHRPLPQLRLQALAL